MAVQSLRLRIVFTIGFCLGPVARKYCEKIGRSPRRAQYGAASPPSFLGFSAVSPERANAAPKSGAPSAPVPPPPRAAADDDLFTGAQLSPPIDSGYARGEGGGARGCGGVRSAGWNDLLMLWRCLKVFCLIASREPC